MLQAMNTGHEGSMSTAHANSPQDLMARLETMALMSDVDLPVEHVRAQIAATIDLVVHMGRLADGRRVISRVSQVDQIDDGRATVRDLFTFREHSPGSRHRRLRHERRESALSPIESSQSVMSGR